MYKSEFRKSDIKGQLEQTIKQYVQSQSVYIKPGYDQLQKKTITHQISNGIELAPTALAR